MSETELVRKSLPKAFVDYVETKMSNGSGREHLCKKLGSMDAVLDLLRIYFETRSYLKTARKFKSSKVTVWTFIRDIGPFLEDIKAYLHYEDAIRVRDFKAYPIIQEWERKIRRSGQLSALDKIATMKNICGYNRKLKYVSDFRCSPEKFDLDKSQEFVDLYLKEHPDKIQIPRHLRLAIRHFLMVARGISIPRGYGSQYGLSGDKGKIGQYANVRLTRHQTTIMQKIADNDPYAREWGFNIAYEVGLMTCSRAFAIASMSLSWIPQEIPPDTFRVTIKVFESKVKEGDRHLGKIGLLWKKHILKSTWTKIREYARQKERTNLLFLDTEQVSKVRAWLDGFRDYMKGLYKQAGVTEQYFYDHPIHGLRHAGAQRLLEITNWNYGLVAQLGGWKTKDTLERWYGAIPDHIVDQGAEEALKKLSEMGDI